MTSILLSAVVAMMIPSTAMATLGDTPGSFTPAPTGNGRGVAYDGALNLYYTLAGDVNIYNATTAGVSQGAIAEPGRTQDCGGLDFNATDGKLWCGTYDGSADINTIDLTTGAETTEFNVSAHIADDSCYGTGIAPFIDGIAIDSDGTVWISGDGARTIIHVDSTGALLGSFTVPDHPSTAQTGCSTGLDIVPGGFLELAMQAGPDLGPHVIVKIQKLDNVDNPPLIADFVTLVTDNPGVEDVSYDANTFAPLCVMWATNFGFEAVLTAYEVQCTRTMGYWKNHTDDAAALGPIDLGISDDDAAVCMTVTTETEMKNALKAHGGQDMEPKLKAQLLAAKLNVAMDDIPPADLAAILLVIAEADDLLGLDDCDPEMGKRGADRAAAQTLHDALDAFNNKYTP